MNSNHLLAILTQMNGSKIRIQCEMKVRVATHDQCQSNDSLNRTTCQDKKYMQTKRTISRLVRLLGLIATDKKLQVPKKN